MWRFTENDWVARCYCGVVMVIVDGYFVFDKMTLFCLKSVFSLPANTYCLCDAFGQRNQDEKQQNFDSKFHTHGFCPIYSHFPLLDWYFDIVFLVPIAIEFGGKSVHGRTMHALNKSIVKIKLILSF